MIQSSKLSLGLMALSVCALIGCAQPSEPVVKSSVPVASPQAQQAVDPVAAPQPAQAPVQDEAAAFLGVWDRDNNPIVEISRRPDGGLLVREYYGSDPSENVGAEYPAVLKDKKVVAQLDAKNFYKYQVPTFTLLPNGHLKFDSGVGPDELVRTNKPMIKAKFAPPNWTD